MRPEPRRVQGSHAPNVVHGGLKKESKNSEIRNNWADAFSAQRPYFRATSLLFRKKEKTEGGEGIFPLANPPLIMT